MEVQRHAGKYPALTDTQRMVAEARRERIQTYLNSINGPLSEADTIKLGQTIDLVNSNNLSYTGPVLIGTPLQGSATSEFVYDSGSGYLTVNTAGCSNCATSYYNPSLSSTAAASTDTTTSLTYGSA